MTAEQILAAAEQVYAGCRTYSDRGCVRTEFRHADGQTDHVSLMPFETAFVRPDRFRFEFSSHFPNRTEFHRYVVAATGPEVWTWWDSRPGVERPESLGLALAGATGVSGGSAHTVPALLLPVQVSGRWWGGPADLTRLADADLDGVACYRVGRRERVDPDAEREFREDVFRQTGHEIPESEPEAGVLWFDRGTLLVRRIEGGHRYPTYRTETVTTYEPTIDEPVPDDRLRFDPPDQNTG